MMLTMFVASRSWASPHARSTGIDVPGGSAAVVCAHAAGDQHRRHDRHRHPHTGHPDTTHVRHERDLQKLSYKANKSLTGKSRGEKTHL